ncbi:hypothetical protein TURU_068033 [Turdus rufiventris]|nr:hypothetical protein TURU_068033 [Turdus rufiventris]
MVWGDPWYGESHLQPLEVHGMGRSTCSPGDPWYGEIHSMERSTCSPWRFMAWGDPWYGEIHLQPWRSMVWGDSPAALEVHEDPVRDSMESSTEIHKDNLSWLPLIDWVEPAIPFSSGTLTSNTTRCGKDCKKGWSHKDDMKGDFEFVLCLYTELFLGLLSFFKELKTLEGPVQDHGLVLKS